MTRKNEAWTLVKETYRHWSSDQCARMAAALAYYTTFSLAPLLILLIAIAGLFFGREAAQGRLLAQFEDLVGADSAKAIQSMIVSAWHPAQGVLATIIGVITLLVGATGVLSELKQALNEIWKTHETGGFAEVIKTRAKLLGMILGIGFLMMVSLALSAVLAAISKFFSDALPMPAWLMQVINLLVSLGVITVLFALIFKYLPDVVITWRDVWIGAFGTAVLFTVGKSALGVYLGQSAIASSFGAAGSVLIILLWIYYSSLILYFGAEFTHLCADRNHSHTKIRR